MKERELSVVTRREAPGVASPHRYFVRGCLLPIEELSAESNRMEKSQ